MVLVKRFAYFLAINFRAWRPIECLWRNNFYHKQTHGILKRFVYKVEHCEYCIVVTSSNDLQSSVSSSVNTNLIEDLHKELSLSSTKGQQ